MPTNDLDTRFWRACDILRRDDNTQSLLDYVEQISWLLFLKSFEDLEDTRVADAEYEGRPFERVIDGFYRWSVWTGGRVNRAQAGQREAEAALRSAQKTLLGLETMLVPDPDALDAARRAFREAEAAVSVAAAQVESERQAQRDALAPLLADDPDEAKRAVNHQTARGQPPNRSGHRGWADAEGAAELPERSALPPPARAAQHAGARGHPPDLRGSAEQDGEERRDPARRH
jgi:hypothetical protein